MSSDGTAIAATGADPAWPWPADPAPATPPDTELCRAFARCFAQADGQLVLDHLRRLMLDRRLAPRASDSELRHLEGQRFAVAHIITMIERGRLL